MECLHDKLGLLYANDKFADQAIHSIVCYQPMCVASCSEKRFGSSILASKHITLKQCLINVDAMTCHHVVSILIQHCIYVRVYGVLLFFFLQTTKVSLIVNCLGYNKNFIMTWVIDILWYFL